VCPFVSKITQKSYERILMTFFGVERRKLLDFDDGDPDSFADSASSEITNHWEIGRQLTLRCVRHMAAPFFGEGLRPLIASSFYVNMAAVKVG